MIGVTMKRFKKTSNDQLVSSDRESSIVLKIAESKWGLNPMTLMAFFVVSLMVLTLVFSVAIVSGKLPSDCLWTLAEARFFHVKPSKVSEDDIPRPVIMPKDKLLGGLLPSGFDETSCLSRYESLLYIKGLRHKPSSYLISRLRRYEALHKQCGPYTELYNRTVDLIKSSDQYSAASSVCNYVIWVSFSGLGNRILTLTSAFLYALLTNRVLLVDPRVNLPDLFCEPFPQVSWLLPSDFPILDQFSTFNQKSPLSYGYMVRNNKSRIHPFMYLHLNHDYDAQDKLFFCDTDQTFLKKIPWLFVKSNNYYVPALFLIPSFEQELNNLFPEKGTVFHFLGRYLFHPTNTVWGLITRYYQAYLANADEKIGIQIRVFDLGAGNFKYVLDQILACTTKENLLPQVNQNEPIVNSSEKPKTISVLMTSLSPRYFEEIRNMYWENPTVTGEIVSVYQPSHEEHQQTEKLMHDRKAWAEMYLLSLTDKLVTSAWSTFGYVAQGLGGLKPWILYKFENGTVHNPPCFRDMSLEPCYHSPPNYDCKKKTAGYNTGNGVPHVRHCKDMTWGLKLFDRNGEL
ncbi:PREDICTED: galactoside 2-alpha-L-fucosyltransferase-like [Nicotiana attenuata]|uniref:Fucosyltransferase n=1 Tax=Nicotiana attenuata TaxID=49451 RepID=A0A1J6IUR8_NICAT|nr:PREDICTED: galactoside 2-alpha-L-fucosyltransferase-like [Nicotiana attenuata]OIT04344.1 galactoside 2-alpha-l-fucosyltransferase [Nicotiana attenuata]